MRIKKCENFEFSPFFNLVLVIKNPHSFWKNLNHCVLNRHPKFYGDTAKIQDTISNLLPGISHKKTTLLCMTRLRVIFSNSTSRYIRDRGIEIVDWPGNSPDMNPIENIWNVMKKQIGKLPNNKTKLWNSICSVWYGIPRQTIMELYDSMPERIQAVCKEKGGPTKY